MPFTSPQEKMGLVNLLDKILLFLLLWKTAVEYHSIQRGLTCCMFEKREFK